MDNLNTSKTVSIQFYVVSYIDILGQTSELSKWDMVPNEAKKSPEFEPEVFQCLSRIRDLNKYYTHLLKSNDPVTKFDYSPQEGGIFKLRHISDAVIAYSPITINDGETTTMPAFRLLLSSAFLMLDYLAQGIPIRGGISIGFGTDSDDFGGFYGPALARAYYLESKKSRYPRILVCDRFMSFLNSKVFCRDNKKNIVYQKIAAECINLIKTNNTENELNYADASVWKHRPQEDKVIIRDLIKHAYSFAMNEVSARNADADEIYKKYVELLAYLSYCAETFGYNLSDLDKNVKNGSLTTLPRVIKTRFTSSSSH